MKNLFQLSAGNKATGIITGLFACVLFNSPTILSAQSLDVTGKLPMVSDTTKMAGALEISFADAAATEAEDVGTVVLDVEISDPGNCTVGVAINAGYTTATAGADFTFIDPSPIIFTAGGPTAYSINIDVIDDAVPEPSEDLVLYLVDVTGSCITVSPSTYILTIEDNDGGGGTSSISFWDSVSTNNESVGTVPVSVAISEAADCSVDVALNTSLTTATEGTDFTFSDPTTVTFTAGGALLQTLDIAIINDGAVEPSEDIVFDLTNISGCTLSTPTQTVIHINDDDNVGISENNAAGVNIYFTGSSLVIQLEAAPAHTGNLTLINENGQIILSMNIYDQQTIVNTNSIPAGMYIAKLNLDEKVYQQKYLIGK